MAAYLISLKEAFVMLSQAREEALAELAEPIKKEEYLLRRKILNESERWDTLYYQHDFSLLCSILRRTAIALAAVATAISHAEQEQEPSRPLNLTLGKTRPGFAGHGK